MADVGPVARVRAVLATVVRHQPAAAGSCAVTTARTDCQKATGVAVGWIGCLSRSALMPFTARLM